MRKRGYNARMKKRSLSLLGAVALAASLGGSAFALDNPMVVDLHAMKGSQRAASATIFGSGSNVLVNVTAAGASVPKAAPITLNDGDCAKPGDIAFALSALSDNQSLTKLEHPLADIAGKAKSMVIHQTSSLTSPEFACGKVTG
jgi:hypothetical protein